MKTANTTTVIATAQKIQTIDITQQVTSVVYHSGVKNGLASVFCRHTTAAVIINECEPGLSQHDIPKILEQLVSAGQYRHDKTAAGHTMVGERENGRAHLQSIILSTNQTVPIKDGELALGKWQNIIFVELDGPRPQREIMIQIIGE
ncbi:MAG: YjbQ family protein [Candidatus Magasanikbacteria bacterium]|nr:YjbQ family protein [Candidatus Magasanikbacteria bacterium]